MRAWRLASLLGSILLSLPAQAVEVGGIGLGDTWTVDGQTLLLNGAGVREYGLLGIDVYVAALYLPAPERDAQAILRAAYPRVLHMHFLRSATREDTQKAWDLYLAHNCPAPCQLPAAALAQFRSLIPATVAGETQTFVFGSNGVEIYRAGQRLGAIADRAFAERLLSTWIGAVPTTEALKRALLGTGR